MGMSQRNDLAYEMVYAEARRAGIEAFRDALLEAYGGGKSLPDYKAFLENIVARLLAESQGELGL